MSLALALSCIWVIAAAITAFLPLRLQYVPGLSLLAAAPVLIWFLAQSHGPLLTAFAVFAVLSMFRRPLIHLFRKATGAADT